MELENNDITIGIIFVGDAGVGKTQMINRYINGSYEDNSPSTVGPCYSYKNIFLEKYQLSINLVIWDGGGGQEMYTSLRRPFYPNKPIGIILYDITRIYSFNSIKKFWFKMI